MMVHSSADELLLQIEKVANKKFRYRTEVSSLLMLSYEKNLHGVFDDVLFLSKFLTQAVGVLKREGTESETTLPLQTEFKTNLEKLHTLLRTMVNDADEQSKQNLVSRFLNMNPVSMENLLSLAQELSWIKNYQLDQAK